VSHLCHAEACTAVVSPKRLMCPRHWRMVPRHLQSAVWANYRPGQEIDKNPSSDYLTAHLRAVNAVAVAEGRKAPYPGVEEAAR